MTTLKGQGIELEEIRAAAARIAGKVHRTPLVSSRTLGDRAGVELHLKCESFQKTGSFKARGALHKVLRLTEAERARGLVTVSAGNHAQAVAGRDPLLGGDAHRGAALQDRRGAGLRR